MASIIKSIVLNKPNKVASTLLRTYSAKADVTQYETLAVSVPKKNVFHVELNRPDKLNTFNDALWDDLTTCFKALHENPECRVVVLSGRGKHFSAGIDLKSLIKNFTKVNEIDDTARKARAYAGYIKRYQESISSLEVCAKPVLNLIHEGCIGAGVNVITAADVRYCTEDAWFQVKEVLIGVAGDTGVLQRLPKVIGSASVARELCYTARKVTAQEALSIGLVSRVFPDKDTALTEVLNIAETIASMSPVAVQAIKQNLVYSQDRTIAEGLEHICLLNAINHQSEDITKAAIAQATKTGQPDFENL
ncbi:delta(3,5)-Delta(2,4)-dienoyl-CoA isomerase, mitochondrial-like [Galleria mellonella]|uniref:Delta(3,5)-Delta(2,4)-dienoyl-CoA isomerase, mitochondrial-like n=1 Tax=Galleria mellonella TaxID=7137 RepID=A0ABM3MA23_GALME|nr:delta(3,5)-Delta(2,4)-dienoyl-CoA isomerase, mitochondrial-like [Galleria mellonella]